MLTIVRPFLYGVIASLICTLALWYAIPMLLSSFMESIGLLYIGIFTIIPLLIGGFISARQMRSRYLLLYLFIGALVGVTAMSLYMLVTQTTGKSMFTALLVASGGAISVSGSFMGSRRTIKS